MRWFRILLVLIAALVIVAVAAEWISASRAASQWNSYYHGLESDLRRDLTVGMSYEQIDAYLTARQIGHSYSGSDHRVYGVAPGERATWIGTWHVRVVITLDDQRRLQRLDLSQYCICL